MLLRKTQDFPVPVSMPTNSGGLVVRLIYHACRIGLAGLFLWSGIAKAQNLAAFLASIEGFQILPYRWAWLVSITLPYLEIMTAFALLSDGILARAGALVSGAMLAGFIGGILSAWIRGLEINCGCFGQSAGPSNYPWLITRNTLLLAASAVVFAGSPQTTKFGPRNTQHDTKAEPSAAGIFPVLFRVLRGIRVLRGHHPGS
jgi:hypothetical protein